MYLLVALTVATGYYQQRQMTARTPASAQNQQMQMMGKIFPLFFGFIALQVPTGVDLYFVVSNLWQIGQQAIIFRQQDAADAAAKAGGKRGGGAVGSKDAKVIEAKSATSTETKPAAPAAPAKATSGNPQGSSKGASNPSNRSRRRRRRRKGR
jgi:YidC/Oxa1 family membrane protein insertase